MKFKQTLNNAQFHGARRLVESNYRFCWALALTALLGSAIAVVFVTVQRFFSDPTYIEKIETVRTKMLFPSVIICPEINFPVYKIEKFMKEIDYPETLNATYVRKIIRQLSAFFSPDVFFNLEDLENLQKLLYFNDINIEQAGLRLTSTCEEILLRCRWRGNIVNCSSMFQMEITYTGYCCVFNGRSLKREMRDHGPHKVQLNEDIYVDGLGYSNSLVVAVNQRKDLTDIDLAYKWVAIATGQQYVDVSVNGTAVSPGEETWVGYGTVLMQVSDDTSSLASDLRKCNMAHEPLKFFPIYHKTYCLLECEMRRTMEMCHCLKLSHPSLPGVPMCSAGRLRCARRAAVSFAMNECSCPPTCNVEKEESDWYSHQLVYDSNTYDRFYEDLDLQRVSIVRVFVEKRNKKILQRRSYFNCFNLFSQLGGEFNVFLGCSVLTLLELLLLAVRAILHFNK